MRMQSELLIATYNAGKINEFARLLADLPLRLRGLSEFPGVSEVEETGDTFAENAKLKSEFYSELTGRLTLADDSGLEVEALDGAPGVRSARYAGPGASDTQRTARLLEELNATEDAHRRARFVCVIAIADPVTSMVELFRGECTGRIAREPKGTEGFGYDPVFLPGGYAHTFGELPSEIKNRISHRGRAAEAAAVYLKRHFGHSA